MNETDRINLLSDISDGLCSLAKLSIEVDRLKKLKEMKMNDSKEMEKQLLDEVKLITELSGELQHHCCYDDRERKIVDQLIENAITRYGLFKAEGKTQQEYVRKTDFDKHLNDLAELNKLVIDKLATIQTINDTALATFLTNWKEDFRIIHKTVEFLLGEVNNQRLYLKSKNSDFEEDNEAMDVAYGNCKRKLWEIKNGN